MVVIILDDVEEWLKVYLILFDSWFLIGKYVSEVIKDVCEEIGMLVSWLKVIVDELIKGVVRKLIVLVRWLKLLWEN